MPGFGYGPFGHGPFGSFDWAKQVLFRDLPALDRALDKTDGGGRLERWSDSIKPSFDELLRFTRRFGHLRDADFVRTQFQDRIDVNLLEATPGTRTIEVRVENEDTSDPFATLGATSIGWVLKDVDGREFTVNAVHKLRAVDPAVELAGSNELPLTAASAADQLTGVVGFVALSQNVTGTGTAFLAEVSPGDYVAPRGGSLARVQSVTSNTALVLEKPYHGATATNAVGLVTEASRGAAMLRPPALIGLLGSDFGLTVDTHEPEAFQRSSVRDIKQWINVKGAQKSYDIIAKIAGYRAVAFALWRIDPVPDALPLSEVFEIPPGSGKFYTTIEPLRPRFDEVAADTVPLDLFCWETPNWTTDGITPPPGPIPDGVSVGAAVGWVTQGLPILAVTDLGSKRWRLRVGPGVDMHTVAGIGYWYASFAAMAGRFYLETIPVEGPVGEWEFEILAGDTPAFGASVDVSYECRSDAVCGYCRASAIRVEVVPAEVFADPDALLDGVLERLVAKLLGVVPAHVRITDIVHVIGPVQATIGVSVQASVSRVVTAAASIGYHFDITPADALPVDPSHMSVSATVSTTP